MDLSDSVLDHLRSVVALPDLSGTRYELESEIGRGGLGVVYAAHDRELDRPVAIKVLDSALAGEAQLIAGLEHPAIVPIYETGTLPDGRAFYAMKLVTGARLDHYLAGSPSLAERLRILRRVGEALAFAHCRGVIHRDLKPQNVMVGEFGEVLSHGLGCGSRFGHTRVLRPGEAPRFRATRIGPAGPPRHRKQGQECPPGCRLSGCSRSPRGPGAIPDRLGRGGLARAVAASVTALRIAQRSFALVAGSLRGHKISVVFSAKPLKEVQKWC
ncbi:MAG TPA: serine/threonine-protein kinase [Bryobacteraceae bacterium]|jgi:serine/threonine protein kinase|nr:serine/threonine-protein kinase [Bryobacteraceae bacterium]